MSEWRVAQADGGVWRGGGVCRALPLLSRSVCAGVSAHLGATGQGKQLGEAQRASSALSLDVSRAGGTSTPEPPGSDAGRGECITEAAEIRIWEILVDLMHVNANMSCRYIVFRAHSWSGGNVLIVSSRSSCQLLD